jgi:hypothetical protein
LLTRYLDPETIWSELTFWLIMAITFTFGSRAVVGPHFLEHLNEIAIGAVECNVAWGAIDGVFFVLGEVFDIGRTGLWVRKARSATNERAAIEAIRIRLGERIGELAPSPESDRLYRDILAVLKRMDAPRAWPTFDGMIGAVLICLLVSATSLTVALPIWLIPDPELAVRTIHVLLAACLFATGYGMAQAVGLPPLRYGAVMALVGGALGGLAYALGG